MPRAASAPPFLQYQVIAGGTSHAAAVDDAGAGGANNAAAVDTGPKVDCSHTLRPVLLGRRGREPVLRKSKDELAQGLAKRRRMGSNPCDFKAQ